MDFVTGFLQSLKSFRNKLSSNDNWQKKKNRNLLHQQKDDMDGVAIPTPKLQIDSAMEIIQPLQISRSTWLHQGLWEYVLLKNFEY